MKTFYIPDSNELDSKIVMKKTTALCIATHEDDVEIMCTKGILDCFNKKDDWFGAVVVTDGAGSPRNGIYSNFTDEEMMKIRIKEQKKAAYIGEYSFISMLDFSSSKVKDFSCDEVTIEIKNIIEKSMPKVIYTHNMFDKHDTHVAVCMRVINALGMIEKENLPEKLYGCEVWRGLDWLCDKDKTVFDVSTHENISNALMEVFDSQICGGKRYDLANNGRQRANATYLSSHNIDNITKASIAVDMTPIMKKDISVLDFAKKFLDNFKKDIENRIYKFL